MGAACVLVCVCVCVFWKEDLRKGVVGIEMGVGGLE